MSFLSKWNGWRRGQWEDKNSYFFGINASYFNSGTDEQYIPMAGSTSENASPTNANTQFVPDGSGRLVLIVTHSANGTAPGSSIISLTQNGGPGDIGAKTIIMASQTKETFTFRDELTSGTFEWDINDGTSLALSINPTNAHDDMNVFVLFEIYK